jgi:hypothetical protein
MARLLQRPWYVEFVDCCLPHTEAPKNYLFWSAISVLSGILKDKVFFNEGLFTLYPNQFIILAGPPGIGKGTAINFAWKMTKTQTGRLANVLTDKATIPAILDLIAKGWTGPIRIVQGAVTGSMEHSCTIIASELQTLLSSTGDPTTLATFCQLWDQQEYENRTKNQGTNIIKDMCVNVIGGTVPDYIRSMERELGSFVAGGFTARCIFIFEEKKSKELPFIKPIDKSPKSKLLYDKLVQDLDYIAKNIQGEYVLSTDAELVFQNEYSSFSPTFDDSEAMQNFKARMKTHIYKLSMVLMAAHTDSMLITGQVMRDSFFLIRTVRRQIDRIFRGVGSSQLSEPTARVQAIIERRSMCTRSELIQATQRYMDYTTLDKVLYVLGLIGFCEEVRVGSKVYFKQIVHPVGGINPKKP